MEQKVKCKFCEKRLVKQQEWKKEFEKEYCSTCRAFIRYASNLETALQDQMRFLGISKKSLRIEIKKLTPAEKLLEAIGIGNGVSKIKSWES